MSLRQGLPIFAGSSSLLSFALDSFTKRTQQFETPYDVTPVNDRFFLGTECCVPPSSESRFVAIGSSLWLFTTDVDRQIVVRRVSDCWKCTASVSHVTEFTHPPPPIGSSAGTARDEIQLGGGSFSSPTTASRCMMRGCRPSHVVASLPPLAPPAIPCGTTGTGGSEATSTIMMTSGSDRKATAATATATVVVTAPQGFHLYSQWHRDSQWKGKWEWEWQWPWQWQGQGQAWETTGNGLKCGFSSRGHRISYSGGNNDNNSGSISCSNSSSDSCSHSGSNSGRNSCSSHVRSSPSHSVSSQPPSSTARLSATTSTTRTTAGMPAAQAGRGALAVSAAEAGTERMADTHVVTRTGGVTSLPSSEPQPDVRGEGGRGEGEGEAVAVEVEVATMHVPVAAAAGEAGACSPGSPSLCQLESQQCSLPSSTTITNRGDRQDRYSHPLPLPRDASRPQLTLGRSEATDPSPLTRHVALPLPLPLSLAVPLAAQPDGSQAAGSAAESDPSSSSSSSNCGAPQDGGSARSAGSSACNDSGSEGTRQQQQSAHQPPCSSAAAAPARASECHCSCQCLTRHAIADAAAKAAPAVVNLTVSVGECTLWHAMAWGLFAIRWHLLSSRSTGRSLILVHNYIVTT